MKIIGIDAGGSSSVGSLIENGRKLKTITGGFGNMSVDEKMAKEHICFVIDSLIDEDVEKIVIGFSGARQSEMPRYQSMFEKIYEKKVVIISDVVLAYYDLLPQGGLLVIAGTGSIMLYKEEKGFIKAGGWGHLFGDEGSGYSLAVSAIKEAIVCHEKKTPSVIKDSIMSHYKLKNFEDIKFLYNEPKSKIAELSYALSKLDAFEVNQLFIAEADSLATTVIRMISSNELKLDRIALTGSLMKNDLFRESFMKKLGDYDYVLNYDEHSLGAYYYGR